MRGYTGTPLTYGPPALGTQTGDQGRSYHLEVVEQSPRPSRSDSWGAEDDLNSEENSCSTSYILELESNSSQRGSPIPFTETSDGLRAFKRNHPPRMSSPRNSIVTTEKFDQKSRGRPATTKTTTTTTTTSTRTTTTSAAANKNDVSNNSTSTPGKTAKTRKNARPVRRSIMALSKERLLRAEEKAKQLQAEEEELAARDAEEKQKAYREYIVWR